MKINIVIIHQNNSFYLPYSLSQVKSTNPDANIYLIGDKRNNHYKGLNHVCISDYSESAKQFEKVYKHFSTNPYEYELFCFQRWFILRDFMVKESLEKCFYMDSDLMIYENLEKEWKKFEGCEFTLSSTPESDSPSPHCMFINSPQALEDVCDFAFDLYKDSKLTPLMENQYLKRRQHNLFGGACDMTMFREYMIRNPKKIKFTSEVIDGVTYDHCMSMADGIYEVLNGYKKIEWTGKSPYCKSTELGKDVKFSALHFQGGAKHLMEKYCQAEKLLPYNSAKHRYWLFLNYLSKQRGRVSKFFNKLMFNP